MQQPLACQEALGNMHGRFSAESVDAPELLLGLSKHACGAIVAAKQLEASARFLHSLPTPLLASKATPGGHVMRLQVCLRQSQQGSENVL